MQGVLQKPRAARMVMAFGIFIRGCFSGMPMDAGNEENGHDENFGSVDHLAYMSRECFCKRIYSR